MKNKRINEKGITLVALVLTVIIMVIMAGITANALVGENGILGNVMNAKTRHEDEGAKEELQLAWSARMTKFYEDVAAGKATYADIDKYFSKTELNAMFRTGGGQITRINYNEDGTFNIWYKSDGDVNYIGVVRRNGEIIKFERTENNIEYTEVWVSYYEVAGVGTLTYASSKEIKLDGQEPVIQWDITNGLSSSSREPWYYYDGKGHPTDGYVPKIKNVKILDEIIPETTRSLFYYLKEVNEIEGLDKIKSNVIGYSEFYHCEALTVVDIPSSVTTIDTYAFDGCSALTTVNIGNGITSIGYGAFENCTALTTMNISNSVTSIGNMAFYGCTSLTTINIPNSITAIGEYTFTNCKALTTINIPNSVTNIGSNAFNNCTALTTMNIPNSVTSIGEKTFYGCTSLTTVNIPNSVTNIGSSAFNNCTALTTVNIGNGVTSIGDYAFYKCSVLENITIPENIKNMGKSSFRYCSNLTTVNYNAKNASETSLLTAENKVSPAFGDSIKILNIGASVEVLPEYIFSFSDVEEVHMENGIQEIGTKAFYNCEFLKSIEIADSVRVLGEKSFYLCPELSSITIPENIEEIGKNCFLGCSKLSVVNYNAKDAFKTNIYDAENNVVSTIFGSDLKTINIGSTVRKLPEWIFTFSGVEEVNIANGLEEISKKVFYECGSLKSIVFPSSVTTIREYAFYNCSGLKQVQMTNSVTSIEEAAFAQCTSLESINLSTGLTVISKWFFENCNSLQNCTIPDSITKIENYAFRECLGLTTITIPQNVSEIGTGVFTECSNLAEIIIQRERDSITGAPWNAPLNPSVVWDSE